MFLPPWLIQLFGIAVVGFAIAFWAISGHESLLIMSAGMSLIGLGAFTGLRVSVRDELPDEEPQKRKDHNEVTPPWLF
jgi:hypothetical protein